MVGVSFCLCTGEWRKFPARGVGGTAAVRAQAPCYGYCPPLPHRSGCYLTRRDPGMEDSHPLSDCSRGPRALPCHVPMIRPEATRTRQQQHTRQQSVSLGHFRPLVFSARLLPTRVENRRSSANDDECVLCRPDLGGGDMRSHADLMCHPRLCLQPHNVDKSPVYSTPVLNSRACRHLLFIPPHLDDDYLET